ncbi:MAG TPA: efflux RND transporter periplasmic adaptor subunit [Chthonomonadales bacterium]|nr:efflux RND transporter periplasmic adaptor subunit [Chthonomonadales bacterium]
MRRWSRWIIVAVLVGAVVVWQWRAATRPLAVEVGEVREGPLVVDWSAVGYVEGLYADVTSQHVARVVRVAVREGDVVRAGQVLAELDGRAASAQVREAGAGRDAASARDAAARALLREAVAIQDERERAAAAEVVAARERLSQASAALEADRQSVPARVEAAHAEAEAARAALRDAERGGRPEEVAQADAEAAAAEASLARARAERERAHRLLAQGAAAQRDLDAADEAVALAQASLDVRRRAAALLRQGAREDQIAAARARVRATEAQVAVANSLVPGVAAHTHRVAEARAALTAALALQAQARAGRSRVESIRQEGTAARADAVRSEAALEQSRVGRDEGWVRAPFSGVVGRRYVDPGAMASPTAPLFTVVDPSRIWVAAEVDEQDLAPVRVGKEVTVTAAAHAGRALRGVVEQVGAAAIPQTEIRTGARIVRVRVAILSGSERALLKPGMEVHVAGRATLVDRAVLAPSDAIVDDHEGSSVWVVEAGAARRRAVRAGRIVGRDTEIAEGVRPGERVVVSGKEQVREGLRVQHAPAAGAR